MSEKKFKVGDKVKFTGSKLPYYSEREIPYIGAIGKISTIFNYGPKDHTPYAVDFKESGGNSDWCYGENELELVTETSPTPDLSTGYKDDSQKPDMSLIPTDALIGMAKALTYGAKKYEAHNYRKGMHFSRLVAATMRHLSAWNEGKNTDDETGLSHLDHALASLAMLKFMEVNRQDMDNRWLNPIFDNSEIKLTDEEKLEAAKAMSERGR